MNFTRYRIDLRSGFSECKSSVKPFKQCLVIWCLGQLLDLTPGPAIVIDGNDRLFEVLALDPAFGSLGILGNVSGQALITVMVCLKSICIHSAFAP